MIDALFPGFDPPPIPDALSAGGRLRVRQQQMVVNGVHPLTRGPLHPEASRDRTADSHAGDPFTCGACVHLTHRSTGPKSYPKCDVDPVRVTSGPATDVRRWWPACPAYEPENR